MTKKSKPKATTLRIVFIYFILGVLWILFSDRLTLIFFPDPEHILQVQTIKGWFYVAFTTGLLYILIHRELLIQRRHTEETKALSRELHHRVKNNLQLMLSLINLQQDQYQESSDTSMALGEVYLRMESISLIHEQMYHSRSLSSVKIKPYLEELGATIGDFLPTTSESATIIDVPATPELQIEEYTPHITEALPIGLIVSEFLSSVNRIREQRTKQPQVKIETLNQGTETRISLWCQTQRESLFEGTPDNRLSGSLIENLGEQLGSTWKKYKNHDGLSYVLQFKRQKDQSDLLQSL
jgi:two-component sensor histidine kinase